MDKNKQKNIFSKNLKEQLSKHGKTQSDLVTDLKLSSSTVSDWVNAKKYPRMDKVQLIADYLGIYKSDLVEDKSIIASTSITLYNGVDILEKLTETECKLITDYWDLDDYGKKVIRAVMDIEHDRCIKEPTLQYNQTILKPSYQASLSAGTGMYAFDDVPTDQIEVPIEYKDIDFVITVNGHSMEPTYLNKDKVMIKKQSHINIGEIGAFMVNGEAYIKELGKNGLISHNKKYPLIEFKEGMRIDCIGKVVGKLAQ